VGVKDQVPFKDEDLDTLDDFDDDIILDESSEDPLVSAEKFDSEEQARINARHEIEKRNELKALKSELDEWDELLDEDVL
jgi:hypothetical protein